MIKNIFAWFLAGFVKSETSFCMQICLCHPTLQVYKQIMIIIIISYALKHLDCLNLILTGE